MSGGAPAEIGASKWAKCTYVSSNCSLSIRMMRREAFAVSTMQSVKNLLAVAGTSL